MPSSPSHDTGEPCSSTSTTSDEEQPGELNLESGSVPKVITSKHEDAQSETSDSQSDGYETAEETAEPVDQQLDRVRVRIQDQSLSYPQNISEKSRHTPSGTLLSVTTTITSERCTIFCHCQCHKRTTYRTSLWARGIIGSISFHSNCSVLLRRAECNYRPCKRSGQTKTRFTYYAPLWLLGRAITIAAWRQDLGMANASVMVNMPRVISDDHPLWLYVEYERLDRLRESLMRETIYVVDQDGQSLLQVSIFQKRLIQSSDAN
jgi:hypothetical protein